MTQLQTVLVEEESNATHRHLGFAINLVAFDSGGNVISDQRINHRVYDLAGGSLIFDALIGFIEGVICHCFSAELGINPYDASPIPMPGVANWNNPRGGSFVWLADGIKYTFAFQFKGAAASCTHLYVSTATELATLDPQTLEVLAKKIWVNDALYPPMIGPKGHVYALTSAGSST